MKKQNFTLLILLMMSLGWLITPVYSQSYSSQKKTANYKNDVNFNGQWKGGFDETTYGLSGFGGDNIKYVLELSVDGSRVSGYSYTYFQEGLKRYYTICRLTGTIDRDVNELVVTEVERTKFNTPPDFQNCFQTHRLHYEKDSDDMESLRGTWIPAPNQGRGCGKGNTLLTRRVVNRMPLAYMPRKKPTTSPSKKPAPKKQLATVHKKPVPQVKQAPTSKMKMEKTETVRNMAPRNENPASTITDNRNISPSIKGFENRRKNVLRTIPIRQSTFQLDFYDNGEIDGDSITVFYNGKIVLSHKKLTDKPISLTVALDDKAKENIVTMYADNLGTIPPNTALMIVTDGSKRYEVRIESDTEKSGSVIFTRDKE